MSRWLASLFERLVVRQSPMKLSSALLCGIALAIALPQASIAQQVPDVIIGDPAPDGGGTTSPAPQPPSADGTARFFCEFDGGRHTVMYRPEGQSVSYPWAIPSELGGGWTPERRCQEISARLERYRPDGLLELQTAFENNYEVVCATTQRDPGCRIVFTVPPGQDATVTLDRVFESLVLADSGQQTTGVNTFSGGGDGLRRDLGRLFGGNRRRTSGGQIDLLPFLAPADGGTGAQLQERPSSPAAPREGRRLNPDAFR